MSHGLGGHLSLSDDNTVKGIDLTLLEALLRLDMGLVR